MFWESFRVLFFVTPIEPFLYHRVIAVDPKCLNGQISNTRKRALRERNKDRIADNEFSGGTHTDIRRRIQEYNGRGDEGS